MRKNEPHLAMEILKRETKRTRFWKTAFIVGFSIIIVECIIRKDGTAE